MRGKRVRGLSFGKECGECGGVAGQGTHIASAGAPATEFVERRFKKNGGGLGARERVAIGRLNEGAAAESQHQIANRVLQHMLQRKVLGPAKTGFAPLREERGY